MAMKTSDLCAAGTTRVRSAKISRKKSSKMICVCLTKMSSVATTDEVVIPIVRGATVPWRRHAASVSFYTSAS